MKTDYPWHVMREPITLTDEELHELYRLTQNAYINPNNYPALVKLLERVARQVAV